MTATHHCSYDSSWQPSTCSRQILLTSLPPSDPLQSNRPIYVAVYQAAAFVRTNDSFRMVFSLLRSAYPSRPTYSPWFYNQNWPSRQVTPHETEQKVICPISCYFLSPEAVESSTAPSTVNTAKTLIFIIIQKQRLSHCSVMIQVSTACRIATCCSLSQADNTDVPLRSNRHDSAWPATYSTLCPYRGRRTAIKCGGTSGVFSFTIFVADWIHHTKIQAQI